MFNSHEEYLQGVQQYRTIELDWDLGMAEALKNAATRDENTQRQWQFVSENAQLYREMRELKRDITLYEISHDHERETRGDDEHTRLVAACETFADAHTEIKDALAGGVLGNGVEQKDRVG